MDETGGNVIQREARLDAPGALLQVMVRGMERKRIVSDDKDRKSVMDRMGNLTVETDTVIVHGPKSLRVDKDASK